MSAIAHIHGRLGGDPEVRYSEKSNTAFASYSIANTRTVGNEKVTDWYKIKAIGKTAEFVGKYLHKGSEVIVHGDLQIEKFTARDGHEVSQVIILANNHEFCGTKESNEVHESPAMADGFMQIDPGTEELPFV